MSTAATFACRVLQTVENPRNRRLTSNWILAVVVCITVLIGWRLYCISEQSRSAQTAVAMLATAATESHQAIIVTDGAGIITTANREALELLNVPSLIGQHAHSLCSSQAVRTRADAAMQDAIDHVRSTGEPLNLQLNCEVVPQHRGAVAVHMNIRVVRNAADVMVVASITPEEKVRNVTEFRPPN